MDDRYICFLALSSYPLLSGKSIRRLIGPDVHTTNLAKELQKKGYQISFITYSDGGIPVEIIDDIKIIKVYKENSNINPLLKAISIWNAMRKAGSSIYYYHGGAAGLGGIFCKMARKKFVWHIAHDKYVSKDLRNLSFDRLGTWLDLIFADKIIAQTEFQKNMLKKNFGKDSILIKNHYKIIENVKPKKAAPSKILWVGSMAEVKQPDLFLKLASSMPEADFQMIGGPSSDEEAYFKLKTKSDKIFNLDFLGFVSPHIMNDYFYNAEIFVNTARSEGFPYAFIEAWMNYTPIVSLNCNPDGIITKYNMGFHSKTFDQLVNDVKRLYGDKNLREEMGLNGRTYVENEHDISKIIYKFIDLFRSLNKDSAKES